MSKSSSALAGVLVLMALVTTALTGPLLTLFGRRIAALDAASKSRAA